MKSIDSNLISGLCSYHWLMGGKTSDNLISVLTQYKPGTILVDTDGHHWSRRAKMVRTRHRFISSVGDDQEKYYEQKYVLTVPITPQSPSPHSPHHPTVPITPQSPSSHSPHHPTVPIIPQSPSPHSPHHPTVPITPQSPSPHSPHHPTVPTTPQSPPPHSPHHPTVPITPQSPSPHSPHHPTVPGNTGASSILGRVLC